MSRSISKTRFPVCANEAAKLLETKVLPAPEPKELTVITCKVSVFTFIKVIFVRTIRKASVAALSLVLSSSSTPPLATFAPVCLGISPRNGTLVRSSISLRLRMRVSNSITNSRMAAGKAKPTSVPISSIDCSTGSTGSPELLAVSITRAFDSVMARLSAFSSRLLSR